MIVFVDYINHCNILFRYDKETTFLQSPVVYIVVD